MLPLRQPTVRNSAMGFRIQSLQEKVAIYERMWSRTLQEMENGTYRRDLFKARRRRVSSPQVPAVKPLGSAAAPEQPEEPGKNARPTATGAEPVIHIAGRPAERVDPLAQDVEYRVFIKDGKAVLRAVPKS